jgi:hypothetical protein
MRKKKYNIRTFILDVGMCFMTGGLWLIWIYCREQRNK